MMTTITVHGGLPDGIRDHHGIFGEANSDPAARLLAARNKAEQLRRKHSEAKSTLRLAVEDDAGTYDFAALKSNVHNLARELETAEAEQEEWESVNAQLEKTNREQRFYEVVAQAQKVKDKLREHYLAAARSLGEWYALGSEARELFSALGDRLPNGTVYHNPELKEGRAAFDANPDPRAELLEQYREISTFESWKRQLSLIPLVEKENEK
jgi:hypothetical protein